MLLMILLFLIYFILCFWLANGQFKSQNQVVKNPTDIFDKEINQKKNKTLDKFKYDLHGHTLSEANEKVKVTVKVKVILNSP